ncbi:adult enhancer factor 1-like [Rhipicephalus sanguineus]|uniref:adult enhancer factor 1-like n=1 Tax=Rhipicephalus sanguineus TaxID=34632 RepID=UPI0020C5545E|nr:adult enhancer factor 1-like [Rhipicephalus sanguineus]
MTPDVNRPKMLIAPLVSAICPVSQELNKIVAFVLLDSSGEPPFLRSLEEVTFSRPSSGHTTTYIQSHMAWASVHSPDTSTNIDSTLGRELHRISSEVSFSPALGTSSVGMAVPEPNVATSGLKPFHCHLCPKRFAYKHVLENHIRTHTGERPFKCPTCLKDFARKDYLSYHVRMCRCRR